MNIAKISHRHSACLAVCVAALLAAGAAHAQDAEQAPAAPRTVPAGAVPRLVKFSGTLTDAAGRPRSGTVSVAFAVYAAEDGGAPLWLETQNVQADTQGRFTVLLGAAGDDGLPLELFSSGEPRWLGVRPHADGGGEQPRVLLVSVPYALKAADAETLGGLPASAFVMAEDAARVSNPDGGVAVRPAHNDRNEPGVLRGIGNPGFLSMFTDRRELGNSPLFEMGGNIGLGTIAPKSKFDVFGNIRISGNGNGILFPDGSFQGTAAPDGTVTSIFTGTGLLGGPIFTSGTISLNTAFTDARYAQLGSASTPVTQNLSGALNLQGNITLTPLNGVNPTFTVRDADGSTFTVTNNAGFTTDTGSGGFIDPALPTPSSPGGALNIFGQSAPTSGTANGSSVNLQGGFGNNGIGGGINIQGGNGSFPNGGVAGGNINLRPGTGATNGVVNVFGDLQIAKGGFISFSDGTTISTGALAGSGTVTSIKSGFGLTGGNITTSGTLAIDTSLIPQLGTPTGLVHNIFWGDQDFQGNVTLTSGGKLALSPFGMSFFDGTSQTTAGITQAAGDSRYAQLNAPNTFTGLQTFNGTVNATSFTGVGTGVTGVNAAFLGGQPPTSFVMSSGPNTFNGNQDIQGNLTLTNSNGQPTFMINGSSGSISMSNGQATISSGATTTPALNVQFPNLSTGFGAVFGTPSAGPAVQIGDVTTGNALEVVNNGQSQSQVTNDGGMYSRKNGSIYSTFENSGYSLPSDGTFLAYDPGSGHYLPAMPGGQTIGLLAGSSALGAGANGGTDFKIQTEGTFPFSGTTAIPNQFVIVGPGGQPQAVDPASLGNSIPIGIVVSVDLAHGFTQARFLTPWEALAAAFPVGSVSGGVSSITPGANIAVDTTNPQMPTISVLPSPVFSGTVGAAGANFTAPVIAPIFNGSFTGDGTNLINVNAALLNGNSAGSFANLVSPNTFLAPAMFNSSITAGAINVSGIGGGPGAITVSGSSAAGGLGGNITVSASGNINTGYLRAYGGGGSGGGLNMGGNGGTGGTISVVSNASSVVISGDINSSGGGGGGGYAGGGAGGGAGGQIALSASSGITLSGPVLAAGGGGGTGGPVSIIGGGGGASGGAGGSFGAGGGSLGGGGGNATMSGGGGFFGAGGGSASISGGPADAGGNGGGGGISLAGGQGGGGGAGAGGDIRITAGLGGSAGGAGGNLILGGGTPGGSVMLTTPLVFSDKTVQTTAYLGSNSLFSNFFATAPLNLAVGSNSATLSLNPIVDSNIATGAGINPLKIAGTAATLGASNNTFSGGVTAQSVSGNQGSFSLLDASNLTVAGPISATSVMLSSGSGNIGSSGTLTLTAPGGLTANAGSGSVFISDTSASLSLAGSSGGGTYSLTASGAGVSGSSVSLTANGNITQAAGGNAGITASSVSLTANGTSNGNVILQSTSGDIVLGSNTVASGNVQMTATGTAAAGSTQGYNSNQVVFSASVNPLGSALNPGFALGATTTGNAVNLTAPVALGIYYTPSPSSPPTLTGAATDQFGNWWGTGALLFSNGSVPVLRAGQGFSNVAFTVNPTGGSNGGGVVMIHGDMTVDGKKAAIVPAADGHMVTVHALETPESWLEDFGSGQLHDGLARVSIENAFLETVNSAFEYHVFLTPLGDCRGLYVAKRAAGGFEVRELGGGTANISFDYRIVAKRRGYETVRLEAVPSPPTGPNN